MITIQKGVDGRYRRWENRQLSSLRDLAPHEIDGPVSVIVGVYRTFKDAALDRKIIK